MHGVHNPPPKDETEAITWKVFISPPRAEIRNNEYSFAGNPILKTKIDLEELYCASTIKKLDSNKNTSKIKKKETSSTEDIIQHMFKHRSIHSFTALDKHQESLLEHIKV